jgi:hypothetical protein
MASRTGYYDLSGMGPDGKAQVTFYVSIERLREIQRFGPEWKFDNARLLKEALASPTAVFEGLERRGMQAAFCYAAKPSRRYRKGGAIETPFSPDRVFVVYVDPMPGVNEYEVLDWAIREEDRKKPGYPAGWENDFGRVVWGAT